WSISKRETNRNVAEDVLQPAVGDQRELQLEKHTPGTKDFVDAAAQAGELGFRKRGDGDSRHNVVCLFGKDTLHLKRGNVVDREPGIIDRSQPIAKVVVHLDRK